MRIWHQSFAVLEDVPAYAERIRQHLRAVARSDTQVDLHGHRPGTFPAGYPGEDAAYPFILAMHANQWALNALEASRSGYDAFAMCTLIDPMLREIRTLVEIPVVAAGEVSFHIASMAGYRFGVLAFLDRLIPRYGEQIRNCGLSDRCAGLRAVGFGFQETLRALDSPGPLIDKFRIAARSLIADGADVIIPGEGMLNILLASEGVSRVDDVPLIDSLGLTVKMAETMADLKATTGLSHSRHGWFNAAPRRERVEQVVEFYCRETWLSRNGNNADSGPPAGSRPSPPDRAPPA